MFIMSQQTQGQSLRTDVEIIIPPHRLESILPITVEKQTTASAVDIHLPLDPLHCGLLG